MPIYKVTQKQGNRTITSTIEAKNVASLQTFLGIVSTAKVTTIYEVHYHDTDNIPIDDFNYLKYYKSFAKNSQNKSGQIFIHNVKTTIDENRMSSLIKQYLEIGGLKIDSVSCRLFMR